MPNPASPNPKTSNPGPAKPISLESLYSYYEHTQEDCRLLLERLPEVIRNLQEESGWQNSEGLPQKGPLRLDELQSLFAHLLQKHGDLLQEAFEGLQQDKGYVPLVAKLLEEQVNLETQRLRKTLFNHLLHVLKKEEAIGHAERQALLARLHAKPQSLQLLSTELEEKMDPWQKNMSEYAANYPYCQLLVQCAAKSLSGEKKTILEAIKDFQNFKHPFEEPSQHCPKNSPQNTSKPPSTP